MGRKRHIVVDTGGRLLGAVVHEADIQDRDGAPSLLAEVGAWFPGVGHIFADGAYAGPKLAGARLLFLPKYSPDLNPIEQVFAKLKHLLRLEAPRTVEAVSAAIGRLLDTYTSNECANYFKNAGYDPT